MDCWTNPKEESERSKFKVELLKALMEGLTSPNSPNDVLEIPTTLGISLVES